MRTPEQALEAALAVAGGLTGLAKAIGTYRQRVYQWRVAPPEMVLAIERETGVSRHELRPDIYPVEANPSTKPNGNARAPGTAQG